MERHTTAELAVIAPTSPLEAWDGPPIPGRIVEDVLQGLEGADAALHALKGGDYCVDMRTSVTCSAASAAEALAQATAWCEQSPTARIQMIGYRHDEYPEGDEHQVTLVLSYAPAAKPAGVQPTP